MSVDLSPSHQGEKVIGKRTWPLLDEMWLLMAELGCIGSLIPLLFLPRLHVPFSALGFLARSALPCAVAGSFSFPLVALFPSLVFQWVTCQAQVWLP